MIRLNIIKLALVIVSFSLASCASDGKSRDRANQKIDWTKMQLIDSAAIDSGVKVIWVNPPQRKLKR